MSVETDVARVQLRTVVQVQPREKVNCRLKVKYKCILLHCNSGVMTRQVLVNSDQAK